MVCACLERFIVAIHKQLCDAFNNDWDTVVQLLLDLVLHMARKIILQGLQSLAQRSLHKPCLQQNP